MAEEKQKEKTERYTVVELPTETNLFIKDNQTEKVLDNTDMTATILNKLEQIEKSIA